MVGDNDDEDEDDDEYLTSKPPALNPDGEPMTEEDKEFAYLFGDGNMKEAMRENSRNHKGDIKFAVSQTFR